MDETSDEKPDEKRVQSRADSLRTEEIEAGSDDPEAQAEAILEESETRTLHPVAEEHRTSADTVDPTP